MKVNLGTLPYDTRQHLPALGGREGNGKELALWLFKEGGIIVIALTNI